MRQSLLVFNVHVYFLDEMIGRCMHHMTKRGIKYTAVYTAESSTLVSSYQNPVWPLDMLLV